MATALILKRFLLTFVLALAFGLTRQRCGKPIGFGTFTFVALGACGLALTALHIEPANPLPLLSGIVTGVGFLGAGALLRTGERVVGFTSAATIWIFAVFGLTMGAGESLIAGLLYGAIWIVMLVDHQLESRWIGGYSRRLVLELVGKVENKVLVEELGLPPLASALGIRRRTEDGVTTLTYSLQRPGGELVDLLERLERCEPVVEYFLE